MNSVSFKHSRLLMFQPNHVLIGLNSIRKHSWTFHNNVPRHWKLDLGFHGFENLLNYMCYFGEFLLIKLSSLLTKLKYVSSFWCVHFISILCSNLFKFMVRNHTFNFDLQHRVPEIANSTSISKYPQTKCKELSG